jgi:very-short-patch-repair endonuclease
MSTNNRDRARHLRRNMTDTERFVWERVRYRQIGRCKFRRQHPLGPFVVDFACLERKLVLELDGGQHAERAEEDARRTAWLEERGYRVFRLWNFEAFQDWEATEQRIWELLQEGGDPTPHPNPPPQGGREQAG